MLSGLKMFKVQKVTITRVKAIKGGSQLTWNFDLNGKPFGQVWTFKLTARCTFRYHAKTLAGAYADFATYAEAETFMRGEM